MESTDAALEVIGVRGSTEPQAGSRLLAPIGAALAATCPACVTYTELPYPATIRRFTPPADIDLGDSPSIGVTNLVATVNDTAERNPGRRFVILGYSQGAQVVGDALVPPSMRVCGQDAREVSDEASARIIGIALFGDPRFTKGEPFNAGTFDPGREGLDPRQSGALDRYADRLRDYCAADDVTCQGANGNMEGHVAYFTNAMPADALDFLCTRIRDDWFSRTASPGGTREIA